MYKGNKHERCKKIKGGGKMKEYEVSKETLAIIPISKNKCKIIEESEELLVEKSSYDIINNSCMYFGSSYEGRFNGTKKLIGVSHKSPIIVEETTELIFFPTTSPRLHECAWIALKGIKSVKKEELKSVIVFESGFELDLNISHRSLNNQILRAT